MEVGKRFISFQLLDETLKRYQVENSIQLAIQRSRKIEACRKRTPKKIFSPLLTYGEVEYRCIHGGTHTTTSTGARPNQSSFKRGCKFGIKIGTSTDGQHLVIKEFNSMHNHATSEVQFQSYPPQRRDIGCDMKEQRIKMVEMKANKKLLQCKIARNTGRLIKLKDLHNIAVEVNIKKDDAETLIERDNMEKSSSDISGMLHIAVGSTNPVKITAAASGIAKATGKEVDCHGFPVISSVPDQPIGETETMYGAQNRAINSWKAFLEKHGKAPDYSIGLEGGVTSKTTATMDCFACICIYDGKCSGTSKTASFPLPHAISKLVKEGFELGDADDQVFNTINSKQAGGTVGKLTKGVIPRVTYYEHAVILAFARFNFPDLYDQ